MQGFKFKGTVEVVYNEGRDLFDLSFIKRNKVVKSIDGVFFDSLVEVIDDYVEKTTDYEKRVAAEYSIFYNLVYENGNALKISKL